MYSIDVKNIFLKKREYYIGFNEFNLTLHYKVL